MWVLQGRGLSVVFRRLFSNATGNNVRRRRVRKSNDGAATFRKKAKQVRAAANGAMPAAAGMAAISAGDVIMARWIASAA